MAPNEVRHAGKKRATKKTRRKSVVLPWQKDIEEYRRCQPRGPPSLPKCNHSRGKLECSSLTVRDVERFHKRFYQTRDRWVQDSFILRHCKASTRLGTKRVISAYFIPVGDEQVLSLVCRETFLRALGVRCHRLTRVLRLCKEELEAERKREARRAEVGGKKVTFAERIHYRHFDADATFQLGKAELDSISSNDDIYNNTFDITAKSFSVHDLPDITQLKTEENKNEDSPERSQHFGNITFIKSNEKESLKLNNDPVIKFEQLDMSTITHKEKDYENNDKLGEPKSPTKQITNKIDLNDSDSNEATEEKFSNIFPQYNSCQLFIAHSFPPLSVETNFQCMNDNITEQKTYYKKNENVWFTSRNQSINKTQDHFPNLNINVNISTKDGVCLKQHSFNIKNRSEEYNMGKRHTRSQAVKNINKELDETYVVQNISNNSELSNKFLNEIEKNINLDTLVNSLLNGENVNNTSILNIASDINVSHSGTICKRSEEYAFEQEEKKFNIAANNISKFGKTTHDVYIDNDLVNFHRKTETLIEKTVKDIGEITSVDDTKRAPLVGGRVSSMRRGLSMLGSANVPTTEIHNVNLKGALERCLSWKDKENHCGARWEKEGNSYTKVQRRLGKRNKPNLVI